MSGDPNLKVSENQFFSLSQVCTECISTSCNYIEHHVNGESSEEISQTESHSSIEKDDDNIMKVVRNKRGFRFKTDASTL